MLLGDKGAVRHAEPIVGEYLTQHAQREELFARSSSDEPEPPTAQPAVAEPQPQPQPQLAQQLGRLDL